MQLDVQELNCGDAESLIVIQGYLEYCCRIVEAEILWIREVVELKKKIIIAFNNSTFLCFSAKPTG